MVPFPTMDSRLRGNDALLAGIRLPQSGDEPKISGDDAAQSIFSGKDLIIPEDICPPVAG